MSSARPHFAKNVLFACIDDRLVESHLKFIIEIGGAFYPAVAGGGLAFINEAERSTALKQVAASYSINHINTVYLESHTDCGAYRLAGITFDSAEEDIARLYRDLHQAKGYVEEALAAAGAGVGEVSIHLRVVSPAGELISEPTAAHISK